MLRSRRLTCNACLSSNNLNIIKTLATPQIRTITEKGVKRNEHYAEKSRAKPGFFCLGAVMDPYVPEVYKTQASSLFSIKGLSQRFTLIAKFFTKSFSRVNLWRREGNKGKKEQLISNAVETYKKVKLLQTKKDFQKLNLLCTERVYEQMKKESLDSGKLKWTLHEVVDQQLVHVATRDMKDVARKNKVICQYTVKIVSRQSITPFNHLNPDAPINPEDIHTVEEYVVLEKDILDASAPWRYAGSIDTSKPYKVPSNAEISGLFGPSDK